MLTKIVTAIRGMGHEAGEKVVDAQALRILEQELRDAATMLQESNRHLARLMAREIAEKRANRNCESEIKLYEARAGEALDKGEEALARRVAERICALEQQRDQHGAAIAGYIGQVERMRKAIRETEARIRAMKQELAVVRSTDAVLDAEQMITAGTDGSHAVLGAAEETLSRIKRIQEDRSVRLTAARRLASEKTGSELDRALRSAGILGDETSTADAVLLRIKNAKQDKPAEDRKGDAKAVPFNGFQGPAYPVCLPPEAIK